MRMSFADGLSSFCRVEGVDFSTAAAEGGLGTHRNRRHQS